MNSALPAPDQLPELPQPEEKLLRAPTFSEKYWWIKPLLFVVIIISIIDFGIYKVLIDGKDDELPAPINNIRTEIKNDPSVNWKNYLNKKAKFSIKYPPDYSLVEKQGTNSEIIQIVSSDIPKLLSKFSIEITAKNIAPDISLQQLIDQNKICPGIDPQKGSTSLVNGTHKALTFLDIPCGANTKTVVYTINNSIGYIITLESAAKFNEIKQYFDQIITTMKFY